MFTISVIACFILLAITILGVAPTDAPIRFKGEREEFAKLKGEADTVIKAAEDAKRELTKEEKDANALRFSRMKAIKELIDEEQKFATLKLAGDEKTPGVITNPTDPPGKEATEQQRQQEKQQFADPKKIDREEFSRALAKWGTSGQMEQKFATITTATASGALLPKMVATPTVPTAVNTFREALAAYGIKPIETDNTADLNMPVLDASAGGELSQTASTDTENPPDVTPTYALNVKTYESGSAWFSSQQLLAVGYDLLSYVQTDLAYAKDLALELAIAAAMLADANITQSVTTATTTGFIYNNLVDLNLALPKRYQTLKVILLSQDAYGAAEKLVGGDGHPVLNLDPQNGQVRKFNGTPVLRCDFLQSLAANHTVGLIFSLMGWKLRDVSTQQLARYENVPTRPAQTGLNLIGFHGWGYTVKAVAKLVTPAS